MQTNLTYDSIINNGCKGKLSTRPGYYAGRGPTSSDLGNMHLEMMYSYISNIDKDKAKEFVNFVNDQKDMSATAFLVAFDQFVRNGFDHEKVKRHASDGNTISAHGEAFGLIASVLGRRDTPEMEASASYYLKSSFLRNHKNELDSELDEVGSKSYGKFW